MSMRYKDQQDSRLWKARHIRRLEKFKLDSNRNITNFWMSIEI